MPNFEINHILLFPKIISQIYVDESDQTLFVGFNDGDIYISKVILNYRINFNYQSNVSNLIYSEKRKYFIIS